MVEKVVKYLSKYRQAKFEQKERDMKEALKQDEIRQN